MVLNKQNAGKIVVSVGSAIAGSWVGNKVFKNTGLGSGKSGTKAGMAMGVGLGLASGFFSAYSDKLLGVMEHTEEDADE